MSEINQNIKNNKQLDTDTYIIRDFPWRSKSAIKPYLKLLINKRENRERYHFQSQKCIMNWQKQDSDILIAKTTFESFWDEINSIKNWSNITLAQINKIDLKRLSVFKTLNSQSLSK